MKTVEEIKQFILKRQEELKNPIIDISENAESEDSYHIENRVGKYQFGVEILNFIRVGKYQFGVEILNFIEEKANEIG